jgi:hypothetical protein
VLPIPLHAPSLPWLALVVGVCLGIAPLIAQSTRPNTQVQRETSAHFGIEPSSFHHAAACGCSDGRQFAVGASLFGKNSSRVLVTALRPEPAPGSPRRGLSPCTDIVVLGQAVRLLQVPDDHPFLKRESLKRGIISDVCSTNIQFAEAKKSYDFFADDGSAVTLTDEDTGQTLPPNSSGDTVGPDSQEHAAIDSGQDLTGKDLISLIPSKIPQDDPGQSGFDADDLKEGAYFIVRKRLKAEAASEDSPGGMKVTPTDSLDEEREITVPAGTLGKIEKRAGFRSERLWVGEILPDSAPRPFWRTLLSIPKGFAKPAFPKKVVLPSSQIVEINHFLDQYGLEWTRFGKELDNSEGREASDTNQLPDLYSPPVLPLEENVSTAQRTRVLEAIQSATVGLRLEFKDLKIAVWRSTLVLDDLNGNAATENSPNLLHRQCFVGLDKLGAEPENPPATSQRPALEVTRVDIKVFQPSSLDQVSSDYYAIDLEFLLRPNFASGKVQVVCRFPSAPINLALGQMAERILSSRFEIRRPKER